MPEFDVTEPGSDHPGEAEEGPAPPHLVLIVRHKIPGGGEGKGVIQIRRPDESLVNPQVFCQQGSETNLCAIIKSKI